ncbi:MAG: glycerol-3-phosphate 1-O-acyltransferase PlsY [Candidatus Eremiobacteraeota bacterium]|nr:glycerol-3-phosphate 1-O-acyltransferase PlsY [Candidatus Eremiobacteraeota bacterium]
MTGAFVPLTLAAYVIGSVPFGIVVGRGLFGVDPRTVGSGNIGAANSLRALGKVGAVLVLLGDVVKGVLPTALAMYALGLPSLMVAAVGLATIVGHNWSIFLRFQGGKGVATGLGVLVVLSLWGAVAFGVVWLSVLALSRYSSLSSMLANAAVPPVLLMLKAPVPYAVYSAIALAMVLWRHAPNIKRLAAGTELRIGSRKEQTEPT